MADEHYSMFVLAPQSMGRRGARAESSASASTTDPSKESQVPPRNRSSHAHYRMLRIIPPGPQIPGPRPPSRRIGEFPITPPSQTAEEYSAPWTPPSRIPCKRKTNGEASSSVAQATSSILKKARTSPSRKKSVAKGVSFATSPFLQSAEYSKRAALERPRKRQKTISKAELSRAETSRATFAELLRTAAERDDSPIEKGSEGYGVSWPESRIWRENAQNLLEASISRTYDGLKSTAALFSWNSTLPTAGDRPRNPPAGLSQDLASPASTPSTPPRVPKRPAESESETPASKKTRISQENASAGYKSIFSRLFLSPMPV